jgi:hypothetical protein
MRTVDIQAILSRYSYLYFGGFCHLQNDENVFSIESVGAAFIDNNPINFREVIKDLIKDDAFLSKAFSERYGGLHGINICTTGISPKKRTQIRDKIKELGGRFQYRIDFDTHFLVKGAALRNINKYQLARANNIPIITEAQLSEYFESPEKAQKDKIKPKKESDFCSYIPQSPAKSAAELAKEALNPHYQSSGSGSEYENSPSRDIIGALTSWTKSRLIKKINPPARATRFRAWRGKERGCGSWHI